jgi:hypothetical protein
MESDSAAVNEYGFESLDGHSVKCRSSVEEDRSFLDHFFEDIIDFGLCSVDESLCALDIGCLVFHDKLMHDERLEKFEGHSSGKTALMEL